MNLLFIHDHPFYRDTDGVVYTGGSFPQALWSNYHINFNSINIYARNSTSLKSKNGVSSSTGVTFYLTTYYSSVIELIRNINTINREIDTLISTADVVLIRLPSVLGYIAAARAKRMNKKLWVEQVGNAREALSSYGSILGKLAAPIFEYHNKRIVRKADFVSYVTQSKLQKDYPAQKTAITASVSNVLIKTILKKENLSEEKYKAPLLKIGLIGGFDARYKGQDILLKAISLLDTQIRKNIRISLVGKGDFSWITALVKDLALTENLEYIGPLESGEQINSFLKTLSLYVQPSLTEGMPRATIEAMAMGCPVIGSNVGGIPDIVSEKFLHSKGNANELAQHIDYLFHNREELLDEAYSSLEKSRPYLKTTLDIKRLDFYARMNERLSHA